MGFLFCFKNNIKILWIYHKKIEVIETYSHWKSDRKKIWKPRQKYLNDLIKLIKWYRKGKTVDPIRISINLEMQ